MMLSRLLAATLTYILLCTPASLMIGAPARSAEGVLIDQRNSRFNGEISVIDSAGQRFLFGRSTQGVMLFSSFQPKQPSEVTSDYSGIMALLTAMHPEPKSVFNLGLGGGTLPRHHLTRYPTARVESVEIDPVIIELAKKDFQVANPRHEIVEGDGYQVLKTRTVHYDIIWLDADTSKSGPRTLVNPVELSTLRDHLAPNGIMVVSAGRAHNPGTLAKVAEDYKMGYSHAILVESPTLTPNVSDSVLEAWKSQTKAKTNPTLFIPSHLVAVGDRADLTCAHFWKTYQQWSSQHSPSFSWNAKSATPPAGVCRDL